MAHIAGLIAGGVLANPFDFGFNIITTTTHKTLRGPRGAIILSKGTVNNPLKAVEKTVDNLPTLIDRTVFPGLQGGPHMHTIAAKAVAFWEASQPEYRQYCLQILANAKVLSEALMSKGFKLITNGTDNHMMVADVQTSFGFDGGVAEKVLDRIGLTLNKNVIPDDLLPPYRPSGIRLGTPAITTRGLKEEHMVQIADWMYQALTKHNDEQALDKIAKDVLGFTKNFPLPSDN
jgi:glycine hydroxymethyltransferase